MLSDNFKLTPANTSSVGDDPGGTGCVEIGWKYLYVHSPWY